MDRIQGQDFVIKHTRLASPFLCPELSLRLITPECPLWCAGEGDLQRLGLQDPFWGFCWAGGQALARYILDHPERVAGARVLDFGAGCGVAGIAARRAGARHVLAADVDPLSAVAVGLNAGVNGVEVETATRDPIGEEIADFDVVLLGDVFYEADLSGRVQSWLTDVVADRAQVLMGDPKRGHVEPGRWTRLATYAAPADVDPGTYRAGNGGGHLRRAVVYTIGRREVGLRA
jgi:predicted nicotinamide N-methyase